MTEVKIERHSNYQGMGATVESPKQFLNTKHLRNSRDVIAADGIKEKTGKVERFADMVDFEGKYVSDEAYERLLANLDRQIEQGILTQEEIDTQIANLEKLIDHPEIVAAGEQYTRADFERDAENIRKLGRLMNAEEAQAYTEKFLDVREAWENMHARIAGLHEQGLIEVDEKGYPINPNKWAHDIEGMGELWEWGPIMASTAAVTTKAINPETGIEETYLWCVMKEGEDVWRLPGGSIEKDDKGMFTENPVQAGVRETLEESGLGIGQVLGEIKFKGASTGGRQTKHSWFQDHLVEFQVEDGLNIRVETGSDESVRDADGNLVEKREIKAKGWQKITPEFLENFSESHLRMLREAGIVEHIEDRQEEGIAEKR